jgi:hypothetical protein
VKLRRFFAASFILASTLGWADGDIDSQDIANEQIEEPAKRTPFSFSSHVDVIAPSKINKGFFKGDEVHYAEAQVEGGMVFYYCPTYTEGARAAVGYTATYMRWGNNPWFDQEHFNTLNLTLTGFSKRLDRWFWRTQLTANIDTHEWSGDYTSYDILLWGRYAYCGEDIGVHIGFLAQTGLRLDRVYPILGFDWQISRKLKLNLVYPVNIALEYSLTRHWSIAVAGRFFNSRFRVHHDDIFSRALVRYTNTGAEFLVKYEAKNMSANIHAGTTLGGKFRVANRHNKHAHNYRLDSAGYVGAEVEVNF